MKIILPIFVRDTDQNLMEELGVYQNKPLKEFEYRSVTFYNIDCVGEYTDPEDGNIYAAICSGPHEFISPLSRKEIDNMIAGDIVFTGPR